MGVPLGAYGPVRYTSNGMNIVLSWASVAAGPSPRPSPSTTISHPRPFMLSSLSSTSSVWKRPEPELLLGDLPESREPVRLDDEKEDDQATEDHHLDLLLQGDRHGQAERVGGVGEEDGDEHDEGRPQEGSQHASQSPDDDHEEHQERDVDVEGQRLRAAEVE